MNSSTYLIRLTRVLVLGAVVAGTAASAAGAKAPVGGLPYRDTASSQGYQSRPVAIPDVVERYAAAHPYGSGLSTGSTIIQASGFDWGDYAIGIGTGMGLILLLAGGLAMGRQRRHGVQTA